jgi:hypothetical protein
MTLFELQAWLGHRSPQSTQFYAKISPATLTRAYDDAGYFARNVRTIEVLVDRDAVTSGAAAAGEPWQHYDLGHGCCTYTFFEQCQHRMGCAKCDFYTPKDPSKAQFLEAKENLQKMRAMIPLTDDEQAAVDDDDAALGRLLDRLVDTPTPAGPMPWQPDPPIHATSLPIIEVRQAERPTWRARLDNSDSTERRKCSNGRCSAVQASAPSATAYSSASTTNRYHRKCARAVHEIVPVEPGLPFLAA